MPLKRVLTKPIVPTKRKERGILTFHFEYAMMAFNFMNEY